MFSTFLHLSVIIVLFLFCITESVFAQSAPLSIESGSSEIRIAEEIESLKAKKARLLADAKLLNEAKNSKRNFFYVHEDYDEGSGSSGLLVRIDLSKQSMEIYSEGERIYKWKISTGRNGYETPMGRYAPYLLERVHFSKLYDDAPMPYAVFFSGNFAIHGTDSVYSLGRRASHGCVRLHPSNAKIFYALVDEQGKENTTIDIVR